MKKSIFFISLLIFNLLGCVKATGEFAFKKYIDDKYTGMKEPVEFEKKEKVNWVYIFKEVRGNLNVGVILLKKELVWVDIENRVESVSETNRIIYGKIEGLPDGQYKIALTNGNKLIDEKEFTIFSEQEDYYQFKDE